MLGFDEAAKRFGAVTALDRCTFAASSQTCGHRAQRFVDIRYRGPAPDWSRLASAGDRGKRQPGPPAGFNCRLVPGTSAWAQHAYGLAVDINPLENPEIRNGQADPPAAAAWADWTRRSPAMIRAGDAAWRAFHAIGWTWGRGLALAEGLHAFLRQQLVNRVMASYLRRMTRNPGVQHIRSAKGPVNHLAAASLRLGGRDRPGGSTST